MPLNCPVAPPSQRKLHKDGGGGGGGVAMRARAARAPKAKFCATSFRTPYDTSPTASCAAFFTCPYFKCHLRASAGGGTRVLGVGSKAALAANRTSSGVGLASGSPRATEYLFLHPERLRSPRSLRAPSLRVDRHCNLACCTNKGFRTPKERLARR